VLCRLGVLQAIKAFEEAVSTMQVGGELHVQLPMFTV
jgi:FKBP-type peptidyl-prolyl cis-trans isomerase